MLLLIGALHHRSDPVAAGARRLHQLPDLRVSRHHRGRLDHARRGGRRPSCSSRGVHPLAGHRRRVRGRRRRGHDDGHPAHAVQDQRAAVGHSGDDRALLRQPAHHGQEQRAAAVRADAGLDGRGVGARCRVLGRRPCIVLGWDVGTRDAAVLVLALAAAVIVGSGCSICSSAPISARRCRRPATTRR